MQIMNFVINQNFDQTYSLSILDTRPIYIQFLSILSLYRIKTHYANKYINIKPYIEKLSLLSCTYIPSLRELPAFCVCT